MKVNNINIKGIDTEINFLFFEALLNNRKTTPIKKSAIEIIQK